MQYGNLRLHQVYACWFPWALLAGAVMYVWLRSFYLPPGLAEGRSVPSLVTLPKL